MPPDPRSVVAECLTSFGRGDYEICLQQALSRLGPTPALLLHQLVLICLQRTGKADLAEQMGSRTLDLFAGSPWELGLIRLTTGLSERIDALERAETAYQRCQAYYYAGARNLTIGRNEMAREELLAALALDVNCLESDLAAADLRRLEVLPPEASGGPAITRFPAAYGQRGGITVIQGREPSADSPSAAVSTPPEEEPPPVHWGQVRVFVSSTFQDMQEERDLLVKQVFPGIRTLCRERAVDLVEIDLRWGITEERRGEVLEVCLAEIDASDYFVALLGDRYGWVPEALPADLVAKRKWLSELAGRSVTELEILHVLLNGPVRPERTFFYFRAPASSSARREPPDALLSLKSRIRESGRPLREGYPSAAEGARNIEADLSRAIERDYPAVIYQDDVLRERAGHESFATGHVRSFVPRPHYLERLNRHLTSEATPLLMVGEEGVGKSALLAFWVRQYRAAEPSHVVIEHYVGATPESGDYRRVVRRIMAEIGGRWRPPPEHSRHYEAPADADLGRLLNAFQNDLLLVGREPATRLVVVLDGCNHLEDVDEARQMGWLPRSLPGNVRLILSTRGRAVRAAEERGWKLLRIEPFELGEMSEGIAAYFRRYGKALSHDQIERLVAAPQCTRPLYLRTLLKELRIFGVFEKLDDNIAHYLEAETTPDLFLRVFSRLEHDFDRLRPELVEDSLRLLASARRGLAEDEVRAMLGSREAPIARALWSPLFLALEDEFTLQGGVLRCLREELLGAVRLKYLARPDQRGRTHRALADFFAAQPPSDRAIDELPWHLLELGEWGRLEQVLSDLDVFQRLQRNAQRGDLLAYWRILIEHDVDVVEVYDAALARAERSGMPRDRLAALIWEVARFSEELGRVDGAERLYRRSIGLGIELHGEAHPSVATLREDLGRLIARQGRLEEGEALLEQALRSKERALGPMHPSIATSLMASAELFEGHGDLERAKRYCARALEIREMVRGFAHRETAASLMSLGRIAFRQREYDRARLCCERASEVFDQLGLKSQGAALQVEEMLAEIHRVESRYPEALALYREILERKQRTLGEGHASTAFTLGRIGLLRALQGSRMEGLELCRQALAVCQLAVGPGHPYTTELKRVIAALQGGVPEG